MARYRLTWGKGLNLDLLPSELGDGFASAGQNVRFRNGFAERVPSDKDVGDLTSAQWIDIAHFRNTGSTFIYVSNGGTAGSKYIYSKNVAGGLVGGSDVDITPNFFVGFPITSITNSGTTATLSIFGANRDHGMVTGDTITVTGATPAEYNVTDAAVTVINSYSFTYVMASDPGGAASAVGSYNSTSTPSLTGRPSASDFNGVHLINIYERGLYYKTSAAGQLTYVSGAYQARVSRPFKNHIFQLGIWASGVFYPVRVAWSDAAEPGTLPASFTASATNQAGDVELAETNGELVDCLPLGDANIIYKEDSRYAAQYVGGNDVYRFTRLPGVEGLYDVGCVVDTPVGHVFLSKSSELFVHQGGEAKNVSRGRVNVDLTDQAGDGTSYVRAVLHNASQSEVWVYHGPKAKFYIWNYAEDTWGVKDASSVIYGQTFSYLSEFSQEAALLSATASKVYLLDAGTTSGSSYVQRSGIDMAEPDVVKSLHRSRWNFDGTGGATFSIEHGSAMTADGSPTYASAATYTLGTTDYVNQRATGGRYLAVKCTWSSSSLTAPGKVRSTDLDVAGGGKR